MYQQLLFCLPEFPTFGIITTNKKSIELVLCSPMKLRHRQTPYRNRNFMNLILCLRYVAARKLKHKGKVKGISTVSSE